MENFTDNDQCFVCGTKNSQGLQLTFHYNEEKERVESQVTFPPHFQGWGNVVHGGLISTILDEIMVKAAEFRQLKCVTGELNVKFKRPTLVSRPYNFYSKIIETKRRLIFTEAGLEDQEGKICALASAKLFTVD